MARSRKQINQKIEVLLEKKNFPALVVVALTLLYVVLLIDLLPFNIIDDLCVSLLGGMIAGFLLRYIENK